MRKDSQQMADFLQSELSKYGQYEVKDDLNLSLPHVSINIKQTSDKKFSYERIDVYESRQSKVVTTKKDTLSILLVPIIPIHLPSHETDYIFLKFDKEISLEKQSTTTFDLVCPIEIGVYAFDGKNRFLLDSFTCDPLHSRFGIYGDLDKESILCKFMNIPTEEVVDFAKPFVYARMPLKITNELSKHISVQKIVIPSNILKIFYHDIFSATNEIRMIIKKISVTHQIVADVLTGNNTSDDWDISPSESDNTKPSFIMNKGLI